MVYRPGKARKTRVLEEPGIHPTKKPCTEPRCELHGQIHPECMGHAKSPIGADGEATSSQHNFRRPCRNKPVEGSTWCRPHMSPRGKTAADARVMAAAVTYGDPVKISPHAALLGELYRTQGHVNWLHTKVQELDPDDLTWGVTVATERPMSRGKDGDDDSITVEELKRESQPHVWLRLYQAERKHLAEVATMCLRANIEERQMRVIEAHAVILAQVIQMILADARLGIDVSPQVQSNVVREAMERMELLEGATA